MVNTLFLNDKFLASEATRIDPNDRGLLLGDGLFETIRCAKGQALALEEHYQRLCRGAEILKIPLPMGCPELCQTIVQLLSINQLNHCDAGVRLTLTRGVGQRGLLPPSKTKPTLLISCFPIAENSAQTISLTISNILINEYSPLRAFKSVNYMENILARQEALSQNYDDALLCNTKGQIVSASSANIFLVINKELHTPALSCGALPGITRQQILRIAKQQKIPVHERVILPEELEKAEEAFLTNTILQIVRIGQLGKYKLKASTPNAITSQIEKDRIINVRVDGDLK